MSLNSDQIKDLLSSSSARSLPLVLDAIYHSSENEKKLISVLNNLIKNEKTRLSALEYLQEAVPYCSVDTLTENSSIWASHCVPHPSDPIKQLKLRTLIVVLQNTGTIDSFHKKFQSEHLSQLLKSCLTSKCEDEEMACVEALTECMIKYPAWFGNHRNKIETLITEILDSSNQNLVRAASLGFVSFLQTGSSGEGGINYINNFSNYFNKLCATASTLFNDLFEDHMDIDPNQNETIIFKKSDKDLTATRLKNCVLFLKTMILKRFSVEKRVLLRNIVNVINRGLGVHLCLSETRFARDLCIIFKQIQLELLKLFQVLIKSYKHNLLPFGYVLKKTLVQILKNSLKCQCFEFDFSLNAHTFGALNSWLELSGTLSQVHLQEVVVPVLLKHISPIKKTTILASKNRDTDDRNSTEDKFSQRRSLVAEYNCISSLKTLETLFRTVSFSSNPKLFQDLSSVVLNTISDLQIGRIVAPYTNVDCQVKLYEVLISIFKSEDLEVFPSLHLVVNLLSKASNSTNWKISKVSREGLEFLEKIANPVCATFNVHVEKAQVNGESLGDRLLEISQDTGSYRKLSNDSLVEDSIEKNQLVLEEMEEIIVVEEEENDELMIVEEDVVEKGDDKTAESGTTNLEDSTETENIYSQEGIPNVQEISEKVSKETTSVVNEDDISEEMFSTFQDITQQ